MRQANKLAIESINLMFNYKVVVVDLDGTLSMPVNRMHLMPKENLHLNKSWDEFSMAADTDEVNDAVSDICEAVAETHLVVLLSGRCDVAREITEEWLRDNDVNYDYLIMRERRDNRKDTVIKEEVLRQIGLDRISFAIDDNPGVIAHFRSLGITTLDIGTPDANRPDVQNHGETAQIIKQPIVEWHIVTSLSRNEELK